MSELDDKVDRALARFDRVIAVVDEKRGPVASQARRERTRTLDRYGRALSKAAMAVLVVSALTIGVGLLTPIGIFGFLAAVALALGIAGLVLVNDLSGAEIATVPTDVSNGEMVQRFDSFLYKSRRLLPAPAQAVTDSISGGLGTLKTTLERLDAVDPDAQDARRLMSVHLPGLLERYANVPPAYRGEADAEGKTVDQRLVESLEASRAALGEISERLAQRDRDAFATQDRFIQSRYGQPTDLPPAS
ncbi:MULTISPECIES: hypothetical protein [Sphingomonas]|uniref:hypothetical protein n=1 Tax=Sphingomonas TaxID=13687 RepID=UPI000DEF23BA|nr:MULTISPECIES: hypothetical protein [Sphingomonas]